MLLTRVISAVIAIAVLVVVMISPGIYMNIVVSIIALLGLSELFNAFNTGSYKPVKWIGYLSVIYVVLIGWLKGFGINELINITAFIILILSLTCVVFSRNKITFLDIAVTLFAITYVTYLSSFIILTRDMDKGNLFVWFILIGGWLTDSSAYFIGKFWGRNKLITDLSPKKTIEGAAGGTLGGTIAVVLYGLLLNSYFAVNIQLVHYIILGLLLSVFAQIGDLLASAIKRTTNIKDFGNIMPGHGGVIDRFDSIFVIAPIVYFYFKYIAIISF